MFVHRSNRAEHLVDKLSDVLATPLPSVFDSECIAVQGRGMERWLSVELAERRGILANVEFPFPDRLLGCILEVGSEREAELEADLFWALASALEAEIDHPDLAVVRAFLQSDDGHRKHLQLCRRLARAFSQYQIFRPELLREWEGEGCGGWQGRLWRKLRGAHHFSDPVAREEAFYRRLASGEPLEGLPARVSFFGISTLPPYALRVFAALSSRLPVHLFVLSPSREYWADIRSQREQLRARRGASGELFGEEESGPALLLSLGRLHRDFQYLLESTIDYREDEDDLYRPATTGTLLSTLQNDVLHLVDRSRPDVEPMALGPNDRSLSIHSCHSPMRELEVLRDQILQAFADDRELQPRHVVVMAPDIETYAPLIDAVFSDLRFQIADRRPRARSASLDAFCRVLDVVRSRMTASDVLDLLALPEVREAFDILDGELGRLRSWIADSGIRWGIDGEQRARFAQPAHEENTWTFGLDRLFLGYAVEDRGLFCGVRPLGDIEGDDAELLGRFADFLNSLFSLGESLAGQHPMHEWADRFRQVIDSVLAHTDENAADLQRLRELLGQVAAASRQHSFEEPIPLSTAQSVIEEHLERRVDAGPLLAGGITFCELMPMRSIPFRVVCIVGLNDGSFPRTTQALGFDEVAAHPRLGDRNARDDDRYLFLEALLSARHRLILSYCGQSITNNVEIAPSVLVEELIEAVGAATGLDDEATRARLVVKHPLQPFSPRYYDGRDSRLFSYSRFYREGAQSLCQELENAPAFLSSVLPPVESSERTVSLDELARFFSNPAQAFARRLGLTLRSGAELTRDREPMEPDSLERWSVGNELLKSDCDEPVAIARVRAAGAAPLGVPGDLFFEELAPTVGALRAARAELGPALEPHPVDLVVGDTRLTGQIRDRRAAGLGEVIYSTPKGKYEVSLWIRHLVLCLVAGEAQSVLIGPGKGGTVKRRELHPVQAPEPVLRQLLRWYWLGQRFPLCFFPETSGVFTERYEKLLARGKDESTARAKALALARNCFSRDYGAPGEGQKPSVRLLFEGMDPLTEEFAMGNDPAAKGMSFCELSLELLRPMREHLEVPS